MDEAAKRSFSSRKPRDFNPRSFTCIGWYLSAKFKAMPIFSGTVLVLRHWIIKSIDQYKTSLKRVKGFTLIELLIVLAIMGILSVLSLASFQGSGRRQDVKSAASELKTELRKYQNFAISGQKNPNPSDTTCNDPSKPLNVYGVAVNPTGLPVYKASIACGQFPFGLFDEVVITQSVPWASDVEIVEVGHAAGTCLSLVVWFLPVNGGVLLLCDLTFRETVYIEVAKPGGGAYRVFVTNGGEIYEQKN